MPLINNGSTLDEGYVNYAGRRLSAYLKAAGVIGMVSVVSEEDGGMILVVFTLFNEEEDLLLIPRTVDGLKVFIV